jgi:hypothetical protein
MAMHSVGLSEIPVYAVDQKVAQVFEKPKPKPFRPLEN